MGLCIAGREWRLRGKARDSRNGDGSESKGDRPNRNWDSRGDATRQGMAQSDALRRESKLALRACSIQQCRQPQQILDTPVDTIPTGLYIGNGVVQGNSDPLQDWCAG